MIDLFWLASVTFALWLAIGAWWARGVASMSHLQRTAAPPPPRWPKVRIVVPARDEAQSIESAMRSLLALDYPELEIVAVDDRSTDGTGEILERLSAEDPRLEVRHVEELPAGWLGKTHALSVGAAGAAGAWFLFTDADVHFASEALRVAVAYAEGNDLDHLAALPRFVATGPFVAAFMGSFALLFSIYARIWAASDPSSDAAVGIGAFGLVRKAAYLRAGGHDALRLRPDDDLALGEVLKASGAAQEAVFAGDLIEVVWYRNVAEAIRGLRKNAFAGLDFSVLRAIAVVVALVVTHVVPFAAVFFTTGRTQLAYGAVILVIVAIYAWNRRFTDHPVAYAVLHPVGVALLCVAALGSATHALTGGEVEWRGTRYSLEELREARRNGPTP